MLPLTDGLLKMMNFNNVFRWAFALPVPGPVNLPCRRSGHVIDSG
ncbi:hypothetical protein VEE63_41840 [Escherichia coli]|nr:hypothetical protein VEE63_41840 [Escherichia coli]